MRDFTAGHISTDEARDLLATAQEQLGSDELQFYPGVSYRNLLVYRGDEARSAILRRHADHAAPRSDRQIGARRLSARAGQLAAEPIDGRQRRAVRRASGECRSAAHEGKLPATNVWLWGQGRAPICSRLPTVYGKRGAMITAVDLLRGLAALLGWQRIEVPGATGYTDTDYAAKGRYAVAALPDTDLICVHVEATDEASHEGDAAAKIRALEEIDRHIVAPLHAALAAAGRLSHSGLARSPDAAADQNP